MGDGCVLILFVSCLGKTTGVFVYGLSGACDCCCEFENSANCNSHRIQLGFQIKDSPKV